MTMKMRLIQCFSRSAFTAIMLCSAAAQAESLISSLEESSSVEDHRDEDRIGSRDIGVRPIDIRPIGGQGGYNPYCQQYDNYRCNQVPGCQYSRIYNRCVSSGGGQSQPAFCSQFNGEYSNCIQVGCQFDARSGICFAAQRPIPRPQPLPPPRPIPRPQPVQCNYYNYNQVQCQSAGCVYNYQSGACSLNSFPQPGSAVACIAADDGFEEHSSGHQGIGRSDFEASQQALNICRSYHDSCHVTSCQQL